MSFPRTIFKAMRSYLNRYSHNMLYAGAGIIALIMLGFMFRSPIASWYLHKKTDRFNKSHSAELRFDKARILGLASIRITGISLKQATGDTMLTIDTAYASIGILKLFAGRLSIHDVRLINTHITVIETDSSSNWRRLLARQDRQSSPDQPGHDSIGEQTGTVRHGHDSTTEPSSQSDTSRATSSDPASSLPETGDETTMPATDYASMVERMIGFVFDKIPLKLDMRNFTMDYIDNGHTVSWRIDRFDLRDHFFRTIIHITEDSSTTRWVLAGIVDNHQRKAEFRVYPEVDSAAGKGVRPGESRDMKIAELEQAPDKINLDSVRTFIPFLRYKLNAGVCFDTLAFGFRAGEIADDRMELSGFASVKGLTVDHRRIATKPVFLDKLSVEYRMLVGKDLVEIDSSTLVTFNRIGFNPYMRYRPSPVKQITLAINKPWFNAQDLFSSFPSGLFTTLDSLTVRGQLAWHLNFTVDLSNPDSLLFDTSLDRRQFGVQSYGSSNLSRINESFSYTAYEKGEPVRTFIVGPENPSFRTLSQISPYLQYAVMTSEDGGFYQHRGFLPDAFRESIVTNIKERRFARGGSTISMQLVKNVFLSRNKTIARKLEEALIVWLIENQGLSTKERMFEVYLNIIEWGPLIYGANEAARFYFNKDAAKLTLAEAIYMASIIPRPKAFRWSFDETGNLRESNAGFYRLVSSKMLSKGWISQADADKLVPDVELRGPAKLLLKKTEPLAADTVPAEADE